MSKKILCVHNPIAGGKSKEDFLDFMRGYLWRKGWKYRLFHTKGEGDRESLIRSIESYQPDMVVAIGGDGTVKLVAESLVGKNGVMGIIPLGSANGMATELGISSDPETALREMLKSRKGRYLDLMLFNDKYYGLHIADVGMNAHLIASFDGGKSRGKLAYLKHFISLWRLRRKLRYEVEVNGKIYQWRGYQLAFANAGKYGTGIVLNPKSNLSDGKFELVNIVSAKVWDVFKAGFSSLLTIEDYGSREVVSCKEAVVRFKKPQLFQIDGELVGRVSEISVKMVPKAVRIVP